MDCKVQKALETIEEDSFNQNTFFSTKDREAPEKVIIDLNAETVTFKPPDPMEAVKEEIFHPNVSICAPNTNIYTSYVWFSVSGRSRTKAGEMDTQTFDVPAKIHVGIT